MFSTFYSSLMGRTESSLSRAKRHRAPRWPWPSHWHWDRPTSLPMTLPRWRRLLVALNPLRSPPRRQCQPLPIMLRQHPQHQRRRQRPCRWRPLWPRPDAQLAADAQPVKMTDDQLMAKGVDELNKKDYEEALALFQQINLDGKSDDYKAALQKTMSDAQHGADQRKAARASFQKGEVRSRPATPPVQPRTSRTQSIINTLTMARAKRPRSSWPSPNPA